MIDKDAFKQGILSYIDDEIIPHLPTIGKWGMGALITLYASKYDKIYQDLINNTMVKQLNLVDSNGLIDDDALLNAISNSADKYGKMTVVIPIIGTMTFSKDDINKLQTYMHNKSEVHDEYRRTNFNTSQ